MEICPAFISKINSNNKNQVTLLMMWSIEKDGWNYLAVKNICIITRKNSYSYCFICLDSFRAKNKLKSHKKVYENKDFWGMVMPSQMDNVLQFNQYKKLDKIPCIIYAELECLIKKIDRCASNPEKSSTTKISQHILCGCSIPNIWALNQIKN